MVKQKGKKIVVQTGKQQELHAQKTLLPILESPFEIFDDINRMYYGDPWVETMVESLDDESINGGCSREPYEIDTG